MSLLMIIVVGVFIGLLAFKQRKGVAIAALLLFAAVLGFVATSNNAPATSCSNFELALGKNCKGAN